MQTVLMLAGDLRNNLATTLQGRARGGSLHARTALHLPCDFETAAVLSILARPPDPSQTPAPRSPALSDLVRQDGGATYNFLRHTLCAGRAVEIAGLDLALAYCTLPECQDKQGLQRAARKLGNDGSRAIYSSTAKYLHLLCSASFGEGAIAEILPYLEEVNRLAPEKIMFGASVAPDSPDLDQFESAERALALKFSQGALEGYFRPQPLVEQWVRARADEILPLLKNSQWFEADKSLKMLQLIVGTSFGLRELSTELKSFFRRMMSSGSSVNDSVCQFALVGNAVGDIRRAILFTVLRDLCADAECEGLMGSLPEVFEEYLDNTMTSVQMQKTLRKVEGDMLLTARRFVDVLAQDQAELADAHRCLTALGTLPILEEELGRHPGLAAARGRTRLEQRVFPFGQLTLIERYGPKRDRIVYYTCDGRAHESVIAHSYATAAGFFNDTLLDTADWADKSTRTIRGVVCCRIDDAGKLYHNAFDRLAPAPHAVTEYSQHAQAIRSADHAMHARLHKLWEAYPRLIGRINEIGAAVLLLQAGAPLLFCAPDRAEHVTQLVSCSPLDGETAARQMTSLNIETNDPWAGFRLG